MTGAMRSIADALPTAIPSITDPWLGASSFGSHLVALAAWGVAAFLATAWLARRTVA